MTSRGGSGTTRARRACFVAALGCLLSLAGCSASRVSVNDPSTSAYAPANEASGPEISYCNAGPKHARNARREDAYRKMHAACGGPYEIVREHESPAIICPAERRMWFRCLASRPK